jgi:hypothetical protein
MRGRGWRTSLSETWFVCTTCVCRFVCRASNLSSPRTKSYSIHLDRRKISRPPSKLIKVSSTHLSCTLFPSSQLQTNKTNNTIRTSPPQIQSPCRRSPRTPPRWTASPRTLPTPTSLTTAASQLTKSCARTWTLTSVPRSSSARRQVPQQRHNPRYVI